MGKFMPQAGPAEEGPGRPVGRQDKERGKQPPLRGEVRGQGQEAEVKPGAEAEMGQSDTVPWPDEPAIGLPVEPAGGGAALGHPGPRAALRAVSRASP